MPEAEDVLLHAAHRVQSALRTRWSWRGQVARTGEVALSDELRRLGVWLASAFGGDTFSLVACDAPPAASPLARLLGDRARWQDPPDPSPFCDGARIFLPRRLAEAAGGEPRRRLLLMALGQARRASRGSLRALPAEPRARDCAFAIEGALADAFLAREWPGLAAAVDAERERAFRRRPAGRVLRPSERGVEALVRRMLAGSAADGARRVAALLEGDCSAEAVARCAQALAAALPAGPSEARREYRGCAPVPHWGVPRADLVAQAAETLDPVAETAAPAAASRALPRRVESRAVEPDELEARGAPCLVAFGDPELSVQDPAGLMRPRDQGDEPDLDALAEELAGLEAAPRVRLPGPVREVLAPEEGERRAAGPALRARDPEPRELRFPEWDRRLAAYRPDHCRVRVAPISRGEAGFAERVRRERGPLLAQLRRRFEALRPRRVRRGRQLDGDGVDIHGWVEDFADLCAQRTPSGRVYSQERRRRRDVAVVLLLDVSGSTDSHVHGEQRVIDVEKEATLCFCEALHALGDRHAVFAFSGHGPDGVRIGTVKEMDESFDAQVRARIGGLQPEGFTRLGAALRFATARLARERARIRLLLVLSDGKPYDEDEYAGEYGIADVRQAVSEAQRQDVRTLCVNVDREGLHYLPRMVGPGRYTVIWNVQQLPDRLTEIYRLATASS
jgi:nitric oxide reductase NorD protein